ncbi:MAG: glycosyltransferase family 2 protein [Candidatus Hydrogenedentes bacterium]|nr:glycosyltransferase family 2 protein [Candidatus Hydrogenedentota bacterium]
MSSSAVRISIVVPALNESPNLVPLYERLTDVLAGVDCEWELIVVDDGSTDNSAEVLNELHSRDARVRALVFTRNFGQDAAITAGLQAATGDAVIVMDADGQDPPEVIPAMLARWREGYKIVAGRRIRRIEHAASKRAFAFVFYRVMRAATGWDYPLDTGEFRVLDRAVVDVLNACPQRNRLMRTLSSWTGYAHSVVDYTQERRMHGKTKYSFLRSLRLAVTGLTAFSTLPLRIALWLGVFIISMSMVAALGLLLRSNPASLLEWGMLGLLLVSGVQCLLIGIIGEYVGRAMIELQQRPLFVISKAIGLDSPRQ